MNTVTLKPGASVLNVRRGPSTRFDPPQGKMTPGQRGEVMGKSRDGEWVWLAGPDGWVSAAYVVPVPDAVPVAPPKKKGAWRVAASLETMLRQANALAPKRSKTHDGTIGDTAHSARKSDHNPNAEGVVTALDVTHDVKNGCDCGAITEALRKAKDKRLKYVIYGGRMFSSYPSKGVPAWTWRNYTGANKHLLHMHASVLPDPALYDDPREWTLS